MNTVHFPNEYLFENFQDVKIIIEPDRNIVFVQLNPKPRPCVTTRLINEIRIFQTGLSNSKGNLFYNGEEVKIRYHVICSKFPGVFNLGGDLLLFAEYIRNNNRSALSSYARSCIDGIYPFINNYDLPLATISLLDGDALGGGLEIALSSDIVIAEEKVSMGFPEILFNLFPGMGAYHLLLRKVSPAIAEKLISNARIYSATELYEMGIVDILAEDGKSKEELYKYIDERNKQWNGRLAIQKVKNTIKPIKYEELMDVCEIWIDAAMNLNEKDLNIIERIVKAQSRKAEQPQQNNIYIANA